MDKAKIYVYYDGLCKLCSGVSAAIAKSSESSTFTLLDATKGEVPPGFSLEAAMRDVHVLDASGREYRGAEAVFRILDEYSRWRWVSRLGRLPVLRTLSRGIYRVIADNRSWLFGRKNVS